MEQYSSSPSNFGRRRDEAELNLREWGIRARLVCRENNLTNSRRFSASNIRSFREDSRSFRSNVTISTSTASSPGYTLREEIDPSTYSFTSALKALQARSAYGWECASPDGLLALNSKWNDAERYISNPLSGEVPVECLSAKTLVSGRSFGHLTRRITVSAAPALIYPSQSRPIRTVHPPSINNNTSQNNDNSELLFPIKEKEMGSSRDVGTQSTTPPPEPNSSTSSSSSSSSPTTTLAPPVEERSTKCSKAGDDTCNPTPKVKPEEEEEEVGVEILMEEKRDGGEKAEEIIITRNKEKEKDPERKKAKQMCSQGGCLSWRSLWMRRRRRRRSRRRIKQGEKHKNPPNDKHTLLYYYTY